MRRDLIIGVIVSLLIHAGTAWVGEIVSHGAPKPKPKEKPPVVMLMEMPKIEPDEPEPVDQTQQQTAPVDFAPPMQNDVPQLVTDTSFVQKLEPPPPENVSMKGAIVIPQNTGQWAKGIGEIFDISKLDQIPVATVQVHPQYPFEMRRAGISGQVVVDFIVDVNGNVRNAFAASSSQREFESSAVQAVSKWKFRPGKRGGHTVNTHMQVPIVFTLNNDE